MYPSRRDRDEGRPDRGDRAHGQPPVSDFFEACVLFSFFVYCLPHSSYSRRLQRENSTLTVWPPSPKAPSKNLCVLIRPYLSNSRLTRPYRSPERGSSKRRRKHKRDRSPTPSSSDADSENERRRRRKRKEKEREKEKEKEKKRSKEKDRSHKKSRTRSPSPPTRDDADQWVEKTPAAPFVPPTAMAPPAASFLRTPADDAYDDDDDDEEDDAEVGPKLAPRANTSAKKEDERQYGGALLRGEGSAMAAFLKDGTDSRIPRRGEIGLTSDEIAKYETAGYVMSGSRHRVMNAVRMRKENQVISAEEKRGILKLQQEERERRELVLREEFQELLTEKLKGSDGPRRTS
jgi:hypothetical protein